MPGLQRVLIYLLRRDLRLADNPIFREVAKLNAQSEKPFTHVLPVYVFAAEQIETSGFLSSDQEKSPYKEARSRVGRFWRCGSQRVKFVAESVFDLKQDLQKIQSDLVIRVGSVRDAVRSILDSYREREDAEIHGLWMTSEEGWEEQNEEKAVKSMLEKDGKEFRLWADEKYYIDDRDVPFDNPRDLPDVFTSYRKMVEPLRDAPRKQLGKPDRLLPLPEYIPPQARPFAIPSSYDGVLAALTKPLGKQPIDIPEPPQLSDNAKSAHPFVGGSTSGHERIQHLIDTGSMTAYKDTRNGLLGLDFSTKLSAWLALGCISSRQVHWQLVDFENGKGTCGQNADGYGKGESKGSAAVRFELLWRDYMRLCTRKFGMRLFHIGGFRGDKDARSRWISSPYTHSTDKKNSKGVDDENTTIIVERFLAGRTGTGLVDASQRELWLTGWTSNRARQNVASYLSKHLGIDWRIGAEWYEQNLIDYDVSSNWGNWQYVAGVGNDPRGDARVFNPVKQAVDYDTNGEYVRTWVPELHDAGRGGQQSAESGQRGGDSLESLMGVFQAWRLPDDEKKRLGLDGVEWVEKPLVRIDYSVNRRGGGGGRGRGRGGGGRGRRRGGQ